MKGSEKISTASPPRPLPLWVWAGAFIAAAAGIAHLGLLYYIFFSRVAYPLDLEWMESGMLCHALRLMEGRTLYGPPSVEFIPYLYTPLYAVVLAGLGKVLGLSYLLGRLISIIAFTSVLVLVFSAVRRQSGGGLVGALWGLAATGLIACSFQHTGAWFDLARNDSLYLALVTGFLYLLLYRHQSWRALIAAGVLAGLAFLTKQTASLFIIFSGLVLLRLRWRRLPAYVAVVGLVAGGTVLLANHLSDGWFWKYIFEMHQGHAMRPHELWPGAERRLLKLYPFVFGVIGLWLLASPVMWIRRRGLSPEDRGNVYWALVAVMGVVISAVGFATQWASYNAFIPGFLFPSAFAAMAAASLVRGLGHGGSKGRKVLAFAVSLLLGGSLAGQMVWQMYEPQQHIPSKEDRQTGEQLLERLKKIRGPVMMPYHPYYPVLVGKRAWFHQMGTNDVTHAGYLFPEDIRRHIQKKFFAAIILDNPPMERYAFIFDQYKLGYYFSQKEVPRVVAGYQVRPTYLFVPKSKDPPPADGRRVFGFEDGTYKGWTVEGSAFGQAPVGQPIFGQGPVGPFEGSHLANSFHGGDGAHGVLRSPEFLVDHPWITYQVGGGNRIQDLQVRLVVEGRVVHQGTGVNSDIMQRMRVDVRAALGKTMRVELVDKARGSWGHLLFDNLTLRAR